MSALGRTVATLLCASVAASAGGLLVGCGRDAPSPPRPAAASPPALSASGPASGPTSGPASSARTPSAAPPTTREKPDPRWRFYTRDRHRYTSPWFRGSHRIMIGFGCTTAPYYDHHPGCPGTQGFHYGIDIAMPCGTPLYAAVGGTVLEPSAPGSPGAAYGVHPFRIRHGDRDILIGHTITVFVRPGQHVHPGQRIALAADSGAPDGCHLHFEVRPHGGDYTTAVDPARLLDLTAVG